MEKICLTTAYLAPVEYYSAMMSAEVVWLEYWDHYTKQTYRNRCRIATANGIMDLSIPVDKAGKEKILTKDIKISGHSDWQLQHWRSIESAYNSTPFFEYYKDDFLPFYEKKWMYLFDYNQAMQEKVLELLDINIKPELTAAYITDLEENVFDLREQIHPKKPHKEEGSVPYYQVFDQKYGFLPGLSIIDLLFNMGNESILILKGINN